MPLSTAFVRTLFFVLCTIFMVSLVVSSHEEPTIFTYLLGIALGLGAAIKISLLDFIFKKFNLRTFNITILGLFLGYFMAWSLVLIFNALLKIAGISPDHHLLQGVKIFIFLFGTYLGVIMTLRSADEICVSIPFVKFTPTVGQSRDLLLDLSALCDPRLIDFAASGLLDRHLLLPRFLLKELHKQGEEQDEYTAIRAKRSLDAIKKLELLPDLHLRYQDTDFPEVKETQHKVLRLARLLDADILSADNSRMQLPPIEGIRVINLHALSNALKPLMQKGEFIKIKIQRYGKEALQGVGYLEDGTMVVVNGGAQYINESVTARVLSVKHTGSGRMIFCNVAEDEEKNHDDEEF